MLRVADITVTKQTQSLPPGTYVPCSHLPKMSLECAGAEIQTQVWWPPRLVLFPPGTHGPSGRGSRGGHGLSQNSGAKRGWG